MKLDDAVRLGMFSGLSTVEECVVNIKIHSLNLFPYTNISDELLELYGEYEKYKNGDIILDMDEIKEKEKGILKRAFI